MGGSTAQRHRITLASEIDIAGWREKARHLLAADFAPGRAFWTVGARAGNGRLDLFGEAEFSADFQLNGSGKFTVDRGLLTTIETALLHRAEDRFSLAYDIVFRARQQPRLHRNPADSAIQKLNAYAKTVRRDIHKMHAFVRFRKTGSHAGREQYVAWFEPDHHIVETVAPFFRNRFTGMDWLIVTPEARIAWNGVDLHFGPGGKRSDVPACDAVEEEWRSYYSNIFNPARVKTQAMKSEMPVKYWKNLPEAELIAPLVKASGRRVQIMLEDRDQPALFAERDAVSDAPQFASLADLFYALADDARLPTDNFSENIVQGEGPSDARLMIVGEQPGDQEDLVGRPFVGPAGQLLDSALGDAAITRDRSYLTNAVKRFKFVHRGKRRIHQTPNAGEIEHYRWWLDQERKLVRPDVIVALGATATRALTGKSLKIAQYRGQPLQYGDHCKLLVTVHPSYLLRLPDENGRKIEYRKLVGDLKMARELAA